MITIIIDTREQTPLHFPEHLVKTERGTVKTGDYALKGDVLNGNIYNFSVERKSLDDFIQTMCTSDKWEAFQREVARARRIGYCLPVVVEATVDQLYTKIENGEFVPPEHSHPNVSSGFAMKRVGDLAQLGAFVMFADNPMYASAMTYALLASRDEVLNG